jgi:hypothetical protein
MSISIPDHSAVLDERILDIIRRAFWQSAKSVEAVAPHAYVVKGWDKDDVTEEEFWLVVKAIKTYGRREEWTPPAGFYDSGNRRPMRNSYLYVGEYAYWFTFPRGRVAMLNREHISVQQQMNTRRVVDDQTRTGA